MQKLMINETLSTVAKLQAALVVAEASISSLPTDTPYQSFELRLISFSSTSSPFWHATKY